MRRRKRSQTGLKISVFFVDLTLEDDLFKVGKSVCKNTNFEVLKESKVSQFKLSLKEGKEGKEGRSTDTTQSDFDETFLDLSDLCEGDTLGKFRMIGRESLVDPTSQLFLSHVRKDGCPSHRDMVNRVMLSFPQIRVIEEFYHVFSWPFVIKLSIHCHQFIFIKSLTSLRSCDQERKKERQTEKRA